MCIVFTKGEESLEGSNCSHKPFRRSSQAVLVPEMQPWAMRWNARVMCSHVDQCQAIEVPRFLGSDG